VFYVYAYRDPRPSKNNVVFYVGKGSGDRAKHHWNRIKSCKNAMFRGILRKIKSAKLAPHIEILGYYETAQEALAEEIRLIALYGRRDLGAGPLCNMTDGGDGALALSPEVECLRKQKVIDALNRQEVKEKLSKSSKHNWEDPAYRENIAAKMAEFSLSEAGNLLRSIAAKTRWSTPGAVEDFKRVVATRWEGDARKAHSSLLKEKWQEEAYRNRVMERRLETHRTDEYRAAQSAKAKASWAVRKQKQEAL